MFLASLSGSPSTSALHHPQHRCSWRENGKHHAPKRSTVIRFTNCWLLRRHAFVKEDLWVKNGKVINPEARFWEAAREEQYYAHYVVDCEGLMIAPGFIDVQINGAFGVDFSEPSVSRAEQDADIDMVSRRLLEHGVTAYVPTVVTSTPETYRNVLPGLAEWARNPYNSSRGDLSQVLGIHTEGPFISPQAYGAHEKSLLKSPVDGVESLLQAYGSLDCVSIVTMAPELEGALRTISEATSLDSQKERRIGAGYTGDLVVSLGHSMAHLHTAEAGIDCGATFVTHLFNAMTPFHHRDPGLIGLLGAKEHVKKQFSYGLICDGIHSNPASVRIAHRCHPDGAILVTDGMKALGLEVGRYSLGRLKVDIQMLSHAPNDTSDDLAGVQELPREPRSAPIEHHHHDAKPEATHHKLEVAHERHDSQELHKFRMGGLKVMTALAFSRGHRDSVEEACCTAYIAGTKTLAGAVCPMDQCVRNFRRFTQVSQAVACEAASLHPAQMLGIDSQKGSLAFGCDADLVIMDHKLKVVSTYISGVCCWSIARDVNERPESCPASPLMGCDSLSDRDLASPMSRASV